MATQLQIRRGTTAQMGAFTGAEGELAVNTSTDTVHVHDGATAGGFALAKADGSNIGTYAGSFTTISASGAITGNVTGNLTGSVLTAAQTNITSVGTLSTLAITGALTVDTNTFVVDATNNRVGIGITPVTLLDIKEGTAATDAIIGLTAGTGGRAQIRSEAQADNTSSELSFYTMSGTNTSEAIRISGSNVGIGNTVASSMNAGANQLVVGSGSTGQGITLYSSTSTAGSIHFADGTSGDAAYRGQLVYNHSGDYMAMYTAASEAMRISGSNVGIGDNTFAAGKLGVYDSAGNHVWLKGRASDGTSSVSFRNNSDSTYNGRIQVSDTGGMEFAVGGSERLRIDQNGWVNVNANIATDNPVDSAGLHFGWNYSNAEGESLIVFNKGGGSVGGLLFSDNSANGTPAERMRISAEGYVTTTQNPMFRGSYNGSNRGVGAIPQNAYIQSRNMAHSGGNRITVPVAGVYLIVHSQLAASASTQTAIKFNGSYLYGSFTQDVSGSNDSVTTALPIIMAADDYIEFYTYAGTIHGNASYNTMSVTLIG